VDKESRLSVENSKLFLVPPLEAKEALLAQMWLVPI